MPTKWKVVHSHYTRAQPPERSDYAASLDKEQKAYLCPKCKKFVAGIEAGRHQRLYVLRKDVVVDVE